MDGDEKRLKDFKIYHLSYLTVQNLIFKVEIVPAHRILERAMSLAIKYCHFDTTYLTIDVLAS